MQPACLSPICLWGLQSFSPGINCLQTKYLASKPPNMIHLEKCDKFLVWHCLQLPGFAENWEVLGKKEKEKLFFSSASLAACVYPRILWVCSRTTRENCQHQAHWVHPDCHCELKEGFSGLALLPLALFHKHISCGWTGLGPKSEFYFLEMSKHDII